VLWLFVRHGHAYMRGMASTFAMASPVNAQPRAIANWLFGVAALVFIIVGPFDHGVEADHGGHPAA
jgi:hypothetical protein